MDAMKTFIQVRVKTLGIRKSDLARRLGYKNINGGMKAIELYEGGRHNHPFLKNKMHLALEVTPEELRAVEVRNAREVNETRHAEGRRNFCPFLFAKTESELPISNIFANCWGLASIRFAKLPTNFSELPVVEQEFIIKEKIRSRMAKANDISQFFGPILYFILCRTYDEPVRERQVYDLEGNIRENSSLNDTFKDKDFPHIRWLVKF